MTIPRLDYYFGRPVEFVGRLDSSEGDWDWVIQFVDQVIVRNHDKRRKAAPGESLKGEMFLSNILSETETRMLFGHYDAAQAPVVTDEVILTPTLYSISDAKFGEEQFFPQVPVEEGADLPPDPSSDRVAEGPEADAEEVVEASESAAEVTESSE